MSRSLLRLSRNSQNQPSLCKSGGLKADEIGRIDVKDRYAYVAVKRQKLQQVLRQTRGEKIKGIKTIVEDVR